MTWPQSIFYSVFVICMMLIIIRSVVAVERVSKLRESLREMLDREFAREEEDRP